MSHKDWLQFLCQTITTGVDFINICSTIVKPLLVVGIFANEKQFNNLTNPNQHTNLMYPVFIIKKIFIENKSFLG